MTRLRRGAALAAMLLPAACGVRIPSPQQCLAPERSSLRVELLFGLSVPGGGDVPPAQFDAFMAEVVAPRFPAGLTVLPARGRWRDPERRQVEEGSRVVEIDAEDDAATRIKLSEIRTAYKIRFHQKSVGLITIQSCASF